jgi:hypothetical protein
MRPDSARWLERRRRMKALTVPAPVTAPAQLARVSSSVTRSQTTSTSSA